MLARPLEAFDAGIMVSLEKDDAVFYTLLRMGHECPHAIVPHPNPLTKKAGNVWLVEAEHTIMTLGSMDNTPSGIGSWMIRERQKLDAGKGLMT